MTTDIPTSDAILPDAGLDPDIHELAALYVEEMPERIARLQRAFDAAEFERVGRLAHQLKGSASSYGFSILAPLARAVEFSIRDGEPSDLLGAKVQNLVEICARIRFVEI